MERTCTLRYSERPIFGIIGDSPSCLIGLDNYTPLTCHNNSIPSANDGNKLNLAVKILLDQLIEQTAAGHSNHKFANGSANVSDTLQVYALTQCNPDLSSSDCSNCLKGQINQLPSCYNFTVGVRGAIYGPSCVVELENTPFMKSYTPMAQPPLIRQHPCLVQMEVRQVNKRKRRRKSKVWIFIVVLLGFGVLPTMFGLLFLRRRKKNTRKEVDRSDEIKCIDSLEFDYDIIKDATENFSDANRLGKGTSTSTYKGILSTGQEIAVKKPLNNGKDSEVEFNNEVLLLANLQHRNLVKLLGFCIKKDTRLLVYEFVFNESLYWFLYDPIKRAQLDWETRRKIIMGISRGLVYLHEDSQLMVIHRDLKATNILLDVEMNPKISNFSKACRVHADEPRGDASKIKGTYGYMAPEYLQQGHFSQKSDVFSFGVLLLEIINGETINNFSYGENEENLLSFAWRKWSEGGALDVADKSMHNIECNSSEVVRCIKIALLCVQEDPIKRPTMCTVVLMLNSNIDTIAEPSRPAFMSIHSDISTSYCSGNSNNASVSCIDPR